ncbi:hypothetical protein I2I11_18725 [Pontibacter sp. 172403-2]|uniref:hypothetical protein n=1 Tax=Pontibacter rufus TaxID=2791028 RepID=UPI0018AF61AD|nr:hypothetical protein [Pontibacter sp. 172403-2]MBF9255339.1 hypothetical protein [Pontibacter sp. 172403-2]
MKKVFFLGVVCLALGMASCKTYCPAYSYAKPDKQTKTTVSAAVATDKTADRANS